MRSWKAWLLLPLLWSAVEIATPAQAVNGLTIDSLKTFSTFNSCGIRAYYSGDDDTNATIPGFIVPATSDSITGPRDTLTFYRSQDRFPNITNRKFFACSVMFLPATTAIDSQWTFFPRYSDPGGVTNNGTPTTTITTRTQDGTTASLAAETPGKQFYMGPFGDDTNDGLTASTPLATFPAAVAKIVGLAAASRPGSRILLAPGTYYTMRTDTFDTKYVGGASSTAGSMGGTASKHCVLVGSGAVTISGADTTALNPAGWNGVDIGAGVIAYVHAFSPAIWPRAVVLGDTLRLLPYGSFYKLQTDPQGIAASNGCFWETADGDSVYIRPPTVHNGVPTPVAGNTLAQDGPLISQVRVPRGAAAVRIRSQFWRVDSLTFKDFGTGKGDVSITHAVVNLSNQGSVVEHCVFDNLGRPAVAVRLYGSDSTWGRSGWNTIQSNYFRATSVGQSWDGPSKFIGYDKMAGQYPTCPPGQSAAAVDSACFEVGVVYPQILLEQGRGHVVRWNRVYGGGDSFVRTADAYGAADLTVSDTSTTATNDCDIYQNSLVDLGDDNIEPDDTPGINFRVFKNTILGGHDAMNYQITRGPAYFVFNTCINFNGGGILPHGADQLASPGTYDLNGARGRVIFANNTFATRQTAAGVVWSSPQNADVNGQNAYVNQIFVNNLASGRTETLYDTGCKGLNEFNWNIHHISSDTTFLTHVNYSGARALTKLQAGASSWRDSTYGYGKNDGRATTLQFGDSARFDWSPQSTWTVVLGKLNARSMPGINTNLNHAAPGWKINTGNSSDSTYVGAWKVNGMRLEGILSGSTARTRSWFRRLFHHT